MPERGSRRRRIHSALGLTVAAVTAILVVALGFIVAFGVGSGYAVVPTAQSTATNGTGDGFWHAVGSKLVDADGDPVRSTGLNWFGMETTNNTFHGLWARSYQSMIDQMVEQGYNTLRIPYSNDVLRAGATANSIDYGKNPDLQGLTPLQILDKVIGYAGDQGLRVILDRHRPDSGGQSALWYTPSVPESTWIADWKTLAARYRDNPTVIGADLHNEPHNDGGTTGSCWGCGDTARDWRLAAERAGNAVLAVNPDWLILVEGVDCVNGQCGWWGGNLSAAAEYPVRLSDPTKLVYSAHEYATSVFHQTWFDDASFPANLPALWDGWWGYLIKQQTAPVLVGEFGSTLADPKDAIWMRSLLVYLGTGTTGASFTYWSWNPNSGDTGGILNDDWTTINSAKQAILQPYLLGGTRSARTTSTITPTTTTASTTTAPTTTAPRSGTSTCTARVTLQTWPGGFLGKITVTNGGPAATPWTVQVKLPTGVRLQNGWNADVTLSGTTLTAVAPSWNEQLSAGEEVSVGFVAIGSSSPAPDKVRLSGVPCSPRAERS